MTLPPRRHAPGLNLAFAAIAATIHQGQVSSEKTNSFYPGSGKKRRPAGFRIGHGLPARHRYLDLHLLPIGADFLF
jgi:hypothetical protein